MKKQYKRLVQTSVTNFLYCNNHYLFLQRSANKKIDPGKLNGVGGRVDPKENYLDAAIRETKEETGYIVTPSDIQLCGVVKLEGGYEEDWVMCFFKIRVPHTNIPLGYKTEDGEFVWLHKDKVLDKKDVLVDDIQYCFNDIVQENELFFMAAQLNKNQKIKKVRISRHPKK